MSASPSIRLALPDDASTLVPVLARAFDDDPVAAWLLRQDDKRSRAYEIFFGVAYRDLAISHRYSFTDAERRGAALWLPPGRWQMNALTQLWLFPSMVRGFGLSRLLRSKAALDLMAEKHLRAPHWYLFVLGVDPPFQGRGLGKALDKPMLDRCDREGLPAYLETGKERNVKFYRSLGFEVDEHLHLPSGGPEVWLMTRPPQPARKP